jgi:hypothetical protein
VRFVATLLLWLITTAALAVAVPTMWVQHRVVDEGGYAALAQQAATGRPLQDAMASELTDQLVSLSADSGYDVGSELLRGAATAYTRSAAFPGQFATANRVVHRWMFTDSIQQSDASGRWELDLSPMLADSSFQQTLRDFGIQAPSSLQVPLTENVSDSVRPGQLRPLSTWGPWISIGASVVTVLFALLAVATARHRGKVLAALGVSALLVGASGWAAIEVLRRRIDGALDATSDGVRQIADAMVGHAIGSLHQWLNLTLVAGVVLVVLGVLAAMFGGMRRRD